MGTDTEGETPPRKLGHHIHEECGDLFSAPLSTSLAHCVSSDMKMGAGIAVQFRQKFGHIEDLLLQGKTTGEVAFLREGPRFIFYLVTKDRFFNKPTENTLRSSLVAMKTLCHNLGVKKLAMPRVGCGLDGLRWPSVLKMINEVFWNGGIHITIYSIDQMSSPAANYERKSSARYSYPGVRAPFCIDSSQLRSKPSNMRHSIANFSSRNYSSKEEEWPLVRRPVGRHSLPGHKRPGGSEPSKEVHSIAYFQSQTGERSPENYRSRERDGPPDRKKRKHSEETLNERLDSKRRNCLSSDWDEFRKLKNLKESVYHSRQSNSESEDDRPGRHMLKSDAPDLRLKLTGDDGSSSRTKPPRNRIVLSRRIKMVDESPVDGSSEPEFSSLETSSPIRHVDISDRISPRNRFFLPNSKRAYESPVDDSSETSSPIRHVDVSDRIRVELYASYKKNKDKSICHSDVECRLSKTISPRMKVDRNRRKEEAGDNRQCSPLSSYQDLCSSRKRKRNEDEDISEEVGSHGEDEGVRKLKKAKKKKRLKEDEAMECKKKEKGKEKDEKQEFKKKFKKYAKKFLEEEVKKVIKEAHVDEDIKKHKAKKGMKEEDGRNKKKEKKKRSKSDKSGRKNKSTKKHTKSEKEKDERKRRRSETNTEEKLEKKVKFDKNASLKVMLDEIYQQVEVETIKGALSDSFKSEDDDITAVKKEFQWNEKKKTVNNHYSQLNIVNCVESNVSMWDDSE